MEPKWKLLSFSFLGGEVENRLHLHGDCSTTNIGAHDVEPHCGVLYTVVLPPLLRWPLFFEGETHVC